MVGGANGIKGIIGGKSDQEFALLQIQIDKLKKENEQLVQTLEQAQEDQKTILSQSTRNIEEFYDKKGKFEQDLKVTQDKNMKELKDREARVQELEKKYDELEKHHKEVQEPFKTLQEQHKMLQGQFDEVQEKLKTTSKTQTYN